MYRARISRGSGRARTPAPPRSCPRLRDPSRNVSFSRRSWLLPVASAWALSMALFEIFHQTGPTGTGTVHSPSGKFAKLLECGSAPDWMAEECRFDAELGGTI